MMLPAYIWTPVNCKDMPVKYTFLLSLCFMIISCSSDKTTSKKGGLEAATSIAATTEMSTSQTQAIKNKHSFLALGDSYTIGEGVSTVACWPMQLTQKAKEKYDLHFAEPVIIAHTGWRTDELKKAIADHSPYKNYDLVSLLIGVNDQYQGYPSSGYTSRFEELLNIAIQHANNNPSHVIVLSIPDYGYTPFGQAKQSAITKEIDEYNMINKEISERKGVHYFNITDLSRLGLQDPSLITQDNLHPSSKQYSLWVDRILENDFSKILK